MKLVIFEDEKYEQLYPISLTRAVFEFRCGITDLLEKIKTAVPADGVSYFVRDYIAPTFKERYPSDSVNDLNSLKEKDILVVNGRCLLIGEKSKLSGSGGEEWAEKGSDFVYAKVNKKTLSEFKGTNFEELLDFIKSKIKKIETDIKMINYPWDLINYNAEAIVDDFKRMKKSGIDGSMAKESVIYGPKEQVYIAKEAEIHPFVCLDTKHGPVIIDEGAEVHPFTRIEGPCYIGKKSIVLGAKIREGCSIGPVCRIGGEVEESIFHAYSNKFHDGFIGHAYIGEWVNLGALTTNSDLKNDYSNVGVVVKGKPTDTGSIKVGSFIGDHTKTSIGTLINTGAHIGALCLILASGGVLPKYLPSGSWFINNSVTKGFGFKKLLQTAEVAMSRRKIKLTEEYVKLLEKIYEIAKPDRDILINKGKYE
ncbi:MAG: hypothetical protein AUJ85_03230 [Elusimicrobia bacterium CG1_02_37_114]|nr:MAG: hypothetical protein AUJ85_03230 [Elusimicrobia bacterium CG1_02_37_114]